MTYFLCEAASSVLTVVVGSTDLCVVDDLSGMSVSVNGLKLICTYYSVFALVLASLGLAALRLLGEMVKMSDDPSCELG